MCHTKDERLCLRRRGGGVPLVQVSPEFTEVGEKAIQGIEVARVGASVRHRHVMSGLKQVASCISRKGNLRVDELDERLLEVPNRLDERGLRCPAAEIV